MALTKLTSSSTVSYVTSTLTCGASCTLTRNFCGMVIPGSDTYFATANGTKFVCNTTTLGLIGPASPYVIAGGTTLTACTGEATMTGYFFD